MDNRAEVREFLTSRRARVTPDQVGLATYGTTRRVPGLRREEVAQLAGVSVDYYTRVERGNLARVSDSVLAAVARALMLDDVERAHLFALAHAAGMRRPATTRRTHTGRGAGTTPIRESIRLIVDSLVDLPACVANGRMDIVYANRLARALYAPLFVPSPERHPNHARFLFLDPRARSFWVKWDTVGTEIVGALRAAATRDPFDQELTNLIGELATRSDRFRRWWGSNDVFAHRGGLKQINHPVIGRLDLTYEVLKIPTDPDLAVLTYGAALGTPDDDALRVLASWAATAADGVDAAAESHIGAPVRGV